MGNNNISGLRQAQLSSGLYGHLLTCLDVALAEADTATRLRSEAPGELELRDLTHAEVQLVRAYLEQDLRWLCGWHAAAQAQAAIERQTVKAAKSRQATNLPTAQSTPESWRR